MLNLRLFAAIACFLLSIVSIYMRLEIEAVIYAVGALIIMIIISEGKKRNEAVVFFKECPKCGKDDIPRYRSLEGMIDKESDSGE